MNHRIVNQALAVALLGAAATLAGAQTGTGGSNPAAASAKSATAPADASAAHTAMSGMRHKPSKAARTHHAQPAPTPYQAALKRCVEGPSTQRDSCLDDAISQYGRS